VNYDLRNWQLLNKTLADPNKFRLIHRVNRAQLVDDLFSLAWSGDIEYDMALGILGYLEHEDEFVVWVATEISFERINNVAKSNPNYLIFKVGLWGFWGGSFKGINHCACFVSDLYASPAGAPVQAGDILGLDQFLGQHDPSTRYH